MPSQRNKNKRYGAHVWPIGAFGCAKIGMLKFSPKYANGAKHELTRANQGLMDSNDQLVIICVIILTISPCLILLFGM